MENSDSTITSLPKQEPGACGHKLCKRRVTCKVVYNKAWYKKRRMLGYSYWSASRCTLLGYLSLLERGRKRSKKGRTTNKDAVNRYRAKMKELYGGRIEQNSLARARWMIAKEGLHYEKAIQRT